MGIGELEFGFGVTRFLGFVLKALPVKEKCVGGQRELLGWSRSIAVFLLNTIHSFGYLKCKICVWILKELLGKGAITKSL